MSGWQPLPDDLPPEVRHFVEQLRRLKDRTGLSLVALGARTAYSKSSWHRYLNATQPPPRQAVAALCRIAGLEGTDAERLTVRWELAVQAWPRPHVPGPAARLGERAVRGRPDPAVVGRAAAGGTRRDEPAAAGRRTAARASAGGRGRRGRGLWVSRELP